MKRAWAILAALVAANGVGCTASTPDDGSDAPVFGQVERDPALHIERGESAVKGSLEDEGIDVRFSSVEESGVIDVRVELDGMILSAHYENGAETLDGINASDGSPTILTEVDRAAIRRLLAALEAELHPPVDHVADKADYDKLRKLSLAEERLFRVIDAQWSRWPSTLPLRKEISAESAHAYTSWRRYASTNTTVTGCHDCNKCSYSGDCCDSGYKLGEYFNGSNYGNCGTSSSGSQFTKDCTNHDQCVRTSRHGGHALASMYCNDEFSYCVDDESFAPSCKYDWRGTSYKGNCPSSWKGDGTCDCFCQFQDSDC